MDIEAAPLVFEQSATGQECGSYFTALCTFRSKSEKKWHIPSDDVDGKVLTMTIHAPLLKILREL